MSFFREKDNKVKNSNKQELNKFNSSLSRFILKLNYSLRGASLSMYPSIWLFATPGSPIKRMLIFPKGWRKIIISTWSLVKNTYWPQFWKETNYTDTQQEQGTYLWFSSLGEYNLHLLPTTEVMPFWCLHGHKFQEQVTRPAYHKSLLL